MDAPTMAKGAMEMDEAAPSAGGAAASPVSLASAPSEPVAVALLEKGVAEEKAEPVMECMLLLSLVRPLVSLAEMMLVDPDSALEVVLLIDMLMSLLMLEAVSSKRAWMRISWHWSPIHESYRLPKAPLMQRHQRVLPPMASESLPQTEKPPV